MWRFYLFFLNSLLAIGYAPIPYEYKSLSPSLFDPVPPLFMNRQINYRNKSEPAIKDINNKPRKLQVDISYNKKNDPPLKIINAKITNGPAPRIRNEKEEYKLTINNAQGKEIFALPFEIPNLFYGPPPLEGERKQENKSIILDNLDFALTVPYSQEADQVMIKKNGRSISSFPLKNKPLPTKTNNENYITVPTSANKTKFNPLPSYTASQQTLDIAVIGDKYSNLDFFQADADEFVRNFFMSFEPFKSRPSQIALHYINNTADLGCRNYPPRYVFCDGLAVVREVNNSGAPYDFIFVIANLSEPGGSGGTFAIASNGIYGEEILTHEAGHVIGQLLDEYVLLSTNGVIDNKTRKNCYAGNPPAAEWAGLVSPTDYRKGCNYPNHYSSSQSSIMLELTSHYFNKVSQKILDDVITFFAGPPVIEDTTPPVSRITSPTNGAKVMNVVTVKANLSDDVGVVRGELWKDNVLFATDYETPFSFDWATTEDANGYHTLVVKGYDAAGNIGSSPLIKVSVNNTADKTPPVVSISFPKNGSYVSGIVDVAVSASDNSGVVSKVELYKDRSASVFDSIANEPFTFEWDTELESAGYHYLQAKAYDSKGNARSSALVKVTVDNSVDDIPPTIFIKRPLNNQVVSAKTKTMKIIVSGTDNKKVVKIEEFLDGDLIKTCFTKTCSPRIMLTSLASGLHIILVKAYDAAGNMSEKSVTFYRQ